MPAKEENRGKEIPSRVRHAIIALHEVAGMSYPDISTALVIHPETARQIVARARKRAGSENVLEILEQATDPKSNQSIPRQKIKPGSVESQRMKELQSKDVEHWQMTPPEIAREAG